MLGLDGVNGVTLVSLVMMPCHAPCHACPRPSWPCQNGSPCQLLSWLSRTCLSWEHCMFSHSYSRNQAIELNSTIFTCQLHVNYMSMWLHRNKKPACLNQTILCNLQHEAALLDLRGISYRCYSIPSYSDSFNPRIQKKTSLISQNDCSTGPPCVMRRGNGN